MDRPRRAPSGGRRALLALAGGFLIAGAAVAQVLPFRPLAPDTRVTWSGVPSAPRIASAELPIDDRIAPDDFADDDIYEAPPTPAEQAAIDARLAALFPRQDYVPRPAIWRISDHDTTIWLFGTVHVLPPGFRWRSPALEAVVAQAGTLLVESVDDPGARPLSDPRLPPLSTRVNASHRAKLAAFVATLPPEAARQLDTLPTWIAAVAISVARDIRAGEVPGPGADDWLEREFRRRGRPVVAIEDGAKVAAAANAIPDAEARAMLDAALDAPAVDREAARAPLHAWARGEVGAKLAVSLDSRTLGTALLDDRNAAWARTLKARLAVPGTMLFAAGAGHFVGPNSLIARLQALGVRVERAE
jgi:uncharacterized protein YbaP (TraB family)